MLGAMLFDSSIQTEPDYSHERELMARGARIVAGVDEAGRGPLAGPVVVSAVVLDARAIPPGLNDSKKLTRNSASCCSTRSWPPLWLCPWWWRRPRLF